MGKKNIAVVTIIDNFNIGNRLQNLAVQTCLENKYADVRVETIFNRAFFSSYSKINYYKYKLKSLAALVLCPFVKRGRIFKKFNKFNRNIHFSRFAFYKECNYKKIDKCYDFFIIGSDQVWNPLFFNGFLYNHFLMFTDRNKKITFSPSVGIDEIPKEYEKDFREGLRTFERIFVRESNSVSTIKEFADCQVDSMLDPTMFLSKKDWLKFQREVKLKSKYVLCYFLGVLSEDTIKEIRDFADKENLIIINVTDGKNSFLPNYSPDEFLFLVNNAEYIFTDSFHGSVFSFLFHKKFVIFDRVGKKNMSSVRITSLVDNLSISQVLRENMSCVDEVKNQQIDFSKGQNYIKNKKDNFYNYLDEKFR